MFTLSTGCPKTTFLNLFRFWEGPSSSTTSLSNIRCGYPFSINSSKTVWRSFWFIVLGCSLNKRCNGPWSMNSPLGSCWRKSLISCSVDLFDRDAGAFELALLVIDRGSMSRENFLMIEAKRHTEDSCLCTAWLRDAERCAKMIWGMGRSSITLYYCEGSW